jgi:hypothetical protein
MTEHQAALDRIITEILRQAGGDADRLAPSQIGDGIAVPS